MRMPDKDDPLGRAQIKLLQGETVDFLEWEDILDDLAQEPGDEELLQEHGYTIERGLREGESYRAEFFNLLNKYDLPKDDRLRLCYHFAELALDGVPDEQADELLKVYCEMTQDTDYFLGENRENYQGMDGAAAYVHISTEADALYKKLMERVALAARFRNFLAEAKKSSPPKADCDISMADAVFQTYVDVFGGSRQDTVFFSNIEYLLQISASVSALRSVEPLFLYQAITRHDKRLHTCVTLKMNPKALWKYKEYIIDVNNGKNYKANYMRLVFFTKLCDLYRKDPQVDLTLCGYGFDKLSNLGDFYHQEIEWDNFPDPPTLPPPLPEPLEDLTEYAMFSCYEGGGDNVILESDSSLTGQMLEDFESDSKYNRPLDKLSEYINENMAALATRFWNADEETVKAICREILERARLPASWQPKTMQEISLYLAAINGALLDLIFMISEDLLRQAVQALLRETF